MNISSHSTSSNVITNRLTHNKTYKIRCMYSVTGIQYAREQEAEREIEEENDSLFAVLYCSDLAERVTSICFALNSTKPLAMHSNASRKVSQQRSIHRDLDEHTMHLALKYESVRLVLRTLHDSLCSLQMC